MERSILSDTSLQKNGRRRAVFLDRDGTLNAMVYQADHGLVDSPANPRQFELLPGVGEAVAQINKAELLTVVVSNQPGIAKGKFNVASLDAINKQMNIELAAFQAHLDAIYYCTHHPNAVNLEYKQSCNCRKPRPGLILQAAADLNIDISNSYIIGDGVVDIQAGRAAGVRATFFLGNRKGYLFEAFERNDVMPDYIVPTLADAVNVILGLEDGYVPTNGRIEPMNQESNV